MVASVVAFSGCRACENILDVGGATLTGPAAVEPGASNEFTLSGQIGPGKKCPKTIQLSYAEVPKTGANPKSASRGEIQEINDPPVTRSGGVCRLRDPIKIPLSISPGRRDEHRVQITATLAGPAPKQSDLPPANADPLEALAKVFSLLSVGEDRKVVKVNGVAPGTPVNAPPAADFIVGQTPAIAGKPLTLDARQSLDPDGSIVRYEWDLDNDGSFEQFTSSPTAVQVDSAASPQQRITLRVTDNQGLQTQTAAREVRTVAEGAAYTNGTPAPTPETVAAKAPVTVGVRTTSPERAGNADLFCGDTGVFTGTLANPENNKTFSQRCTYSKAGFQRVAVTYRGNIGGSGPPYEPTQFFSLVQVTPAARAAATVPRLSVRTRLTSAKLVRLGKLRFRTTSGTVRGLVATGVGRGRVPKGTPKRYRAALQALASGRFAVKFNGSAKQKSTTITLSGSATLLVRARKSRRTQTCLSVKAAGGGGEARFKVIGATGKAHGFAASGTGPPLTFDRASGRDATITLSPRKGKTRGLTRACRSLARVLGR